MGEVAQRFPDYSGRPPPPHERKARNIRDDLRLVLCCADHYVSDRELSALSRRTPILKSRSYRLFRGRDP